MIDTILEIVDDWIINLSVYGSMLFGLGRRHPKILLIWALIAYAVVCFAHLWLFSGSKPFFGLSAFIALFIALPLIVLYKNEEEPREGRRHVILETNNDWFAERELS